MSFSSIEIRIKDNGLGTIEVIDNGSGIAEPDWASLALKHHTSKLSSSSCPPIPASASAPPSDTTLDAIPVSDSTAPIQTQPDLTQITTFGFRGEALSALCGLCEKVEVVTCTQEMKGLGRTLQFDREGQLVDDSGKQARQRGTTVVLHKLFHPLPVRRKEFERNAKKEFAKALGTLTGYGLVPCSGGWGGDDDAVAEEEVGGKGKDGTKRGVRLIVDGVNKAG